MLNITIQKEKFTELMQELSFKDNELLMKFNRYNPSVAKDKKEEAKTELRTKYLSKSESLIIDLKANKKELTDKRLAIEYPLYKDKDINKMSIGNDQISDAITYLGSTHSMDLILLEVKNAVDLNRIDYASSLVTSILTREPDITNAKQREFRKNLTNLKNKMYGAEHIELKNSIEETELLMSEVEQFNQSISDDYFNFIPKSIAEKFTQNEMNKSIDSINKSQNYWLN